jgi:opacity protein-like surface antigen
MRNQLLSAVAAVAVAVSVMAPRAEAQMVEQTRAVSFGLGGGATLPVGDLSNAFGTGWHAQASLEFNAAGIGMRVDGMWHSIPEDAHDHDLRVLAGVLNALFRFSPGAQVQPYVSAGVGVYNLKLDEDDDDESFEDTRFGINGGAGLRFRLTGLSTFVEVRYHNIFTEGSSTQVVPLTFGIMF